MDESGRVVLLDGRGQDIATSSAETTRAILHELRLGRPPESPRIRSYSELSGEHHTYYRPPPQPPCKRLSWQLRRLGFAEGVET